jgi:hypothetical protein
MRYSYKCTLASIALLAACNNTDGGPMTPSTTAEYVLVSGNGAGLPIRTVNSRGDSTRIWFGALALNADGSYVREQRDSTPNAPFPTAAIQSFDYGTWTSRGDSVFTNSTLDIPVRYPDGRGLKSGTSLRIVIGRVEYAFSKQ